MTRTTIYSCIAYTALFASAVLSILCLNAGFFGLATVVWTVLLTALPVVGYFLARRRSLLSFAFSFLPALPLLAYYLTGSRTWMISAVSLLAVYLLAYNIRPSSLPQPRFTTQKWVSCLILSEVMLVLILLLLLLLLTVR